jgi:peptide chain release factor subunit 1
VSATCLVTVYIPPKKQIHLVVSQLQGEIGTASCIKSHRTKLAVQSALTTAIAKLKALKVTPARGLALFAGEVFINGKEDKISEIIEPLINIEKADYVCGKRFDTEELRKSLVDYERVGFVVMDGSSLLLGTISGNKRETLFKKEVELPKHHKKGGQSSMRFARLRLEARQSYIIATCGYIKRIFITDDRPNVAALVIGGFAELKDEMLGKESDHFDKRLKPIIRKVCKLSNSGEEGFTQLIKQSEDILGRVRFLTEQELLENLRTSQEKMDQMSVIGRRDTMECLEMQAIKKIILWEDIPDLEWFSDRSKEFGFEIEVVDNKSEIAAQFVRAYGGVAAFLRYRVDLVTWEDTENLQDDVEFI